MQSKNAPNQTNCTLSCVIFSTWWNTTTKRQEMMGGATITWRACGSGGKRRECLERPIGIRAQRQCGVSLSVGRERTRRGNLGRRFAVPRIRRCWSGAGRGGAARRDGGEGRRRSQNRRSGQEEGRGSKERIATPLWSVRGDSGPSASWARPEKAHNP